MATINSTINSDSVKNPPPRKYATYWMVGLAVLLVAIIFTIMNVLPARNETTTPEATPSQSQEAQPAPPTETQPPAGQ